MKIKVTLTLDIDPEAWTLDYGVGGAAEIREDVRAYVTNSVREHFKAMGVTSE